MHKAIFFDRDGTLIREIDYKDASGHKSARYSSDVIFLPTVLEAMVKLSSYPFKKVIVTNQSGIARGLYSIHQLHEVNYHMVQSMKVVGATIDGIYWCPHILKDKCACRKPSSEMLIKASRDMNIDLSKSWMIGNSESDVLAGINAGCKTILVNEYLRSSLDSNRFKNVKNSLSYNSENEENHIVRNMIEAVNIIIGK